MPLSKRTPESVAAFNFLQLPRQNIETNPGPLLHHSSPTPPSPSDSVLTYSTSSSSSSTSSRTDSIDPPDPRTITLTTMNCTSLQNYVESVDSLTSNVVCLQETKLTESKILEMDETFVQRWKPLWGAAMCGVLAGGIRSPHIAERGGVATLVKRPGVAFIDTSLTSNLDADMRKRVVHTRIAIGTGHVFLHVLNVYAPSGDNKGAKISREKLLHTVLLKFLELLGNVPVIVCGDLNTDVSRSPTLAHALDNHWCDAAKHQADINNTVAPCTFHRDGSQGTRIDYVLLNASAAQSLTHCWTHPIHNIPSHKAVSIRLSLPAFSQKTLRYTIPKQIPEALTVTDADETGRTLLSKRDFSRHAERGDVEKTWHAAAKACEDFLLLQAGLACNKGFTGRAETRSPTLKDTCAPSTPHSLGASSPKQDRLMKMSYKLQRIREETVRHTGGVMPQSLSNAWKKLLSSAISLKLADPQTMMPLSLSNQTALLDNIQAAVDKRSQSEIRSTRTCREQQYRTKLSTDFSYERKKLTQWSMGRAGATMTAVEREDGTITANLPEIDETMNKHWKNVFCLYETSPEPAFDAFSRRFGNYIKRGPMELSALTGSHLRGILDKKGKKADACGIDGWRSAELYRLPLCLLDAFAQVFNLVETQGVWPEALLTALVTLTPKGDSKKPLEHRPITVTSSVYRLWACARLESIQRWQATWIMPSQHGFRPGHCPDDVLFDLFTQMEDALLGGEPLYGLALDFAKCFDRVPQTLTLDLAEEMGLHSRILKPLRAMYKNLRRRFKYSMGVGEPFTVTNGILQGCPISVILINALLSVMLRCVARSVPKSQTPSFADDVYFLSRDSEAVVNECLYITEEFCDATGMRLNEAKTLAFSSKRNHRCNVTARSGHTFETVESLKALGATFCCHSSPSLRYNPKKYRSAATALAKMHGTQLSSMHKADITSSAILPATLYETAYVTPPAAVVNDLTTATASCIWGSTFNTRSPAALLTICLKAHTADPRTIIAYKLTNNFLRSTTRHPNLLSRCEMIVSRYDSMGNAGQRYRAVGPMGSLLNVYRNRGYTWTSDLTGVYKSAQPSTAYTNLREMPPGKQKHAIRELLRVAAWTDLSAKRPTYAGIEQSIDTDTTNKLWKSLLWSDPESSHRLRRIICGAVLYCHPAGLTRIGMPDADFTAKCPLCLCTTSCHTRHLLWECSRTLSPGVEQKHSAVLQTSHTDIPACLALHGIAPAGYDSEVVRRIQRLLLDRVKLVDTALADRHAVPPATPAHPWNLEFATTRRTIDRHAIYGSLGQGLERWERTLLRKFLKWVETLQWSKVPRDVSCVELVLDFEITMNCLICRSITASIRQRARALQLLITKTNRKAALQQLQQPFVGLSVARVHSLRSIGAPTLIGYNRRPKLHPWTVRILEQQIARAKPNHIGWANEIVPDYSVLLDSGCDTTVR